MMHCHSEIFTRILFSPIALKDIFATLKIRDLGMIYLHQLTMRDFAIFGRALFSQYFTRK